MNSTTEQLTETATFEDFLEKELDLRSDEYITKLYWNEDTESFTAVIVNDTTSESVREHLNADVEFLDLEFGDDWRDSSLFI